MLRFNHNPTQSVERLTNYFFKYLDAHETQSYWIGKGAERLNLQGHVNKKDFRRLAHNVHPHSLERLTPATKDNRRIVQDFTASPPKSLSILWLLSRDERIMGAMQHAMNDTLHGMEKLARTRVRTNGQNHNRPTEEITACVFADYCSRPPEAPEAGSVPDMGLHCHGLIFNHTWDPVEQKHKALEMGRIREEAPYFQALFHNNLAKRVSNLGYAIERRGKAGWEIRGIEQDLIDKFSKRKQEIEEYAKKHHIQDPDKKGELGWLTAPAKDTQLTLQQLKDHWHDQFSDHQSNTILSEAKDSAAGNKDIAPHHALGYAMEHVFERQSTARDTQLITEALKHAVGSFKPEALWSTFENYPWLSGTDEEGRRTVSTEAIYQAEQQMVEMAFTGRGSKEPIGNLDAWQKTLGRTKLSGEQLEAVEDILISRDFVTGLIGKAGVGKTTLMKEVERGLNLAGNAVLPLAPSAEASRGVLRQEGFKRANTVAAYLQDGQLQRQARGNVVWVDEASLLSTKDMKALLETAERFKSRVVLTGDTTQHRSVQAGDAFRILKEQGGFKPIEVSTIRRQQGVYKDAIEALSQGHAGKGFDLLDRIGAVKETPESMRHALLAADYAQAVHDKKSCIVVAPTHKEGEQLTNHIRANLKALGHVGKKDKTVTHNQNLQWTSAQKRQTRNYEKGMTIYAHTAMPGIKAGQQLKVLWTRKNKVIVSDGKGNWKPLPMRHPDRFSVYRPKQIDLAKGDLVRVTQNTKTADPLRSVRNGSTFKVAGFNLDGTIRLKPQKRFAPYVRFDPNCGFLNHGYAVTSHASQGKTCDRVYVAQGSMSFGASSREQLYVSASRGKSEVQIWTDDKQRLRQTIHKSEQRLSATELKHQRAKERRQRYRDYSADRDKKIAIYAYSKHLKKQQARQHQPTRQLPRPKQGITRDR